MLIRPGDIENSPKGFPNQAKSGPISFKLRFDRISQYYILRGVNDSSTMKSVHDQTRSPGAHSRLSGLGRHIFQPLLM